MLSPVAKGSLCAFLAVAVWSGNFIIARLVVHEMPPIQFNFWRWVVALLCIIPFALVHLKEDWASVKTHWKYLTLMGFLGITAMNPLIYKAAQTTESLNMALLVPTAPVMIMILSRIFYGEPITKRRLTGLFIVLIGVLVVVSRGDWERLLAVRFTVGDFWALGGAMFFALYSLLMRHRMHDMSIMGFNTIVFALGLLCCLPFVAAEMAMLPPAQYTTTVWIAILYGGIGCSTVAYWFWTVAADHVGPVYAGFFYYLMPLLTAVSSIFILGEQITAAHCIGALCIIGGILFATYHGHSFAKK